LEDINQHNFISTLMIKLLHSPDTQASAAIK